MGKRRDPEDKTPAIETVHKDGSTATSTDSSKSASSGDNLLHAMQMDAARRVLRPGVDVHFWHGYWRSGFDPSNRWHLHRPLDIQAGVSNRCCRSPADTFMGSKGRERVS